VNFAVSAIWLESQEGQGGGVGDIKLHELSALPLALHLEDYRLLEEQRSLRDKPQKHAACPSHPN